MKDHLNVNVNTFGSPVLGRAQNQGHNVPVKEKTNNETIYQAEESTGDTVDTQLKGSGLFDLSEIDGMDDMDVSAHLSFIREQAGSADGRRLMSKAHHHIDPKQVMQLF